MTKSKQIIIFIIGLFLIFVFIYIIYYNKLIGENIKGIISIFILGIIFVWYIIEYIKKMNKIKNKLLDMDAEGEIIKEKFFTLNYYMYSKRYKTLYVWNERHNKLIEINKDNLIMKPDLQIRCYYDKDMNIKGNIYTLIISYKDKDNNGVNKMLESKNKYFIEKILGYVNGIYEHKGDIKHNYGIINYGNNVTNTIH